ncbi:related to Cyclin H [Sporisorium reilianum f. sp. reilianum]|uniref:Related to Cyclin H n=1 Tax=Sporisorium reilianum f. sp. reilianum TaxID=72559 RepID=A0A2N8UBV2_9BASI|nr:related to Cyclin H [Sporisorium reilianum f. sp. reilianum]
MSQVKAEPSTSTLATPTPAPDDVAGPSSYASSSMRTTSLLSVPALPPAFGPSSLYAQTSQARNWRFSPAVLARTRSDCNAAARRQLSSLHPPSTIPFLSVDDELALIAYYLVKVGQIVHALKLPEVVDATATTFVKRFYLRNSCMHFHPKNIVVTCIFLASKAENYPLNLSDFARKLAGKQATDAAVVDEYRRTVFDLEFLVSQSLLFEYAVTGAHRALYGLLLDVQALERAVSREQLHKLAADAHVKLASSRLTDAEFVYTPSQIALACLRAAAPPTGRQVVTQWLDAKESLARTAALSAKRERQKLRDLETARAAKAKIALARRTKGKAGAKAAEDELALSSTLPPPTVEFDDALLDQHPLGMSRPDLDAALDAVEALIAQREHGKGAQDLERIKQIDVRQKQCMTLVHEREAEGDAKRAKTSEAGFDDDDDDEVTPVAGAEG